VAKADAKVIDRAIAAAHDAAGPMRRLKAYERQAVLAHCARRFEERAEEFAGVLTVEAGKPIRDARGEVKRLIDTFRIAAEEAVRIYGEVLPLDVSERAAHYQGFWKRVPIGPIGGISPWNFPLNLVAHKIAPAIAAGCPIVLKPASATPVSALLIGEVMAESDLPPGAFSILPCAAGDAEAITTDDRLKLLSFTGSAEVGWKLKAKAGRKKVVLELGGNAGCIVDADADVDDAVKRNIVGGFYQSGQSCISVQRLLVHEAIYGEFRERFVAAVKALKMGDPSDEQTFIGPIISERDAARIEQTIQRAVERGGKLLTGGKRHGAMLEPTVLQHVPHDAQAACEEIFGPVVLLEKFSDFNTALATVNHSRYGLQAGVFTRDLYKVMRAWDELEVGGVCINEVPSWRVDHMPYGGVKDSGLGREGLRWAIEEMTEPRLMVVRFPS
jgi:acyl-CoA reductase-like NAD-dependent aldehyde dehydrogenase